MRWIDKDFAKRGFLIDVRNYNDHRKSQFEEQHIIRKLLEQLLAESIMLAPLTTETKKHD